MRRSVVYRIKGRLLDSPSEAEFESMGPGHCAILTPPPSKADQFALVWGASPIYLPWGAELRNACRALVTMELGDMVSGDAPARTPLFSPGNGAAFRRGARL